MFRFIFLYRFTCWKLFLNKWVKFTEIFQNLIKKNFWKTFSDHVRFFEYNHSHLGSRKKLISFTGHLISFNCWNSLWTSEKKTVAKLCQSKILIFKSITNWQDIFVTKLSILCFVNLLWSWILHLAQVKRGRGSHLTLQL